MKIDLTLGQKKARSALFGAPITPLISVKSIILAENINDLIFWENKCRINSDFYNKVIVNK